MFAAKPHPPPADSMDEMARNLALTRRASARDRLAERQLIDKLTGQVRRTAFYLAGPGHREVEDLCQLALVEILLSAGSFRGEAKLERWAERITVRTVLKHLKRQKKSDNTWDEFRDDIPARQAPDAGVDARRVRQRIARLMQRLSRNCRTAMVLHYVHGYPIAEVAEITDTRVNTVRGRLKSGRGKLRRQILADPILREWARGGGVS